MGWTNLQLEEAMKQMAQLARNRAYFYGLKGIDLGKDAADALLWACYRVGAHDHALEVRNRRSDKLSFFFLLSLH